MPYVQCPWRHIHKIQVGARGIGYISCLLEIQFELREKKWLVTGPGARHSQERKQWKQKYQSRDQNILGNRICPWQGHKEFVVGN